ncbi:MAG: response regulator transcription factor [Ruminococcaceae bacterium]|nr:response regulator transcription factor [Oscillospiraceae bacterium]
MLERRWFNLKICICDDDILIHDILKNELLKYKNMLSEVEIEDLFSAEDLVKQYNHNNNYDIIFLDVEMLELNGIEAAEEIRKKDSKVIIIFISSHPNYVFESFNVEPLHFLVKPISEAEFKNVFFRAVSKYNTLNSVLSLKWQNERYQIKISQILYIEAYRRHITVYTENEYFEAVGKLSEMLKVLEPHGFIRTHQGFLVNMDFIKRFDISDVVLFNDKRIMLSVRKRTEALQKFNDYLMRKKW